MSYDVKMKANTVEDFWAKVNKHGPTPSHCPELGECWVWLRATDKRGYGRFVIDKVFYFAHRYSWTIEHGPIEQELCVLHKCDNPSCVRPSHLMLGTNKDNSQDMMMKGRWSGGRSRDGNHPNETHVCVSCGRKRKNQGRGLCGACHEYNRVNGTLDRYEYIRNFAR